MEGREGRDNEESKNMKIDPGHLDVERDEGLKDRQPRNSKRPAIACARGLDIGDLENERLDVSGVVVESDGVDASDVVGDGERKLGPDSRSRGVSEEVAGVGEDCGISSGVEEGEQVLDEFSSKPKCMLIVGSRVNIMETGAR